MMIAPKVRGHQSWLQLRMHLPSKQPQYLREGIPFWVIAAIFLVYKSITRGNIIFRNDKY